MAGKQWNDVHGYSPLNSLLTVIGLSPYGPSLPPSMQNPNPSPHFGTSISSNEYSSLSSSRVFWPWTPFSVGTASASTAPPSQLEVLLRRRDDEDLSALEGLPGSGSKRRILRRSSLGGRGSSIDCHILSILAVLTGLLLLLLLLLLNRSALFWSSILVAFDSQRRFASSLMSLTAAPLDCLCNRSAAIPAFSCSGNNLLTATVELSCLPLVVVGGGSLFCEVELRSAQLPSSSELLPVGLFDEVLLDFDSRVTVLRLMTERDSIK